MFHQIKQHDETSNVVVLLPHTEVEDDLLSCDFDPGECFDAQSSCGNGLLTTGMFDEEGLARRSQWNGSLISSGTYR